jgi:hypothetical protein
MSKKTALTWGAAKHTWGRCFSVFFLLVLVRAGVPAGGPGDPIILMLSAFPVMAACCLLNVVWPIRIAVKHDARWKHAIVWLLCVSAWYSAYRYDVYRLTPGNAAERSSGMELDGAPA